MLNTVCHFEIPADDIPTLQKFYGGLFGWNFTKMPGSTGEQEYHIINTGDESLGGGMMNRQDPSHAPVNYVMVETVEASLNKAVELGAKVIVPKMPVPGMGWFAVLMDPQNNPIGLWQEDTGAA